MRSFNFIQSHVAVVAHDMLRIYFVTLHVRMFYFLFMRFRVSCYVISYSFDMHIYDMIWQAMLWFELCYVICDVIWCVWIVVPLHGVRFSAMLCLVLMFVAMLCYLCFKVMLLDLMLYSFQFYNVLQYCWVLYILLL